MQPFAFCSRCRGMRVGWNRPYIVHCLICKEWLSKSSKLLILTGLLSILVFVFLAPSGVVFSEQNAQKPVLEAGLLTPVTSPADPAVTTLEAFLMRYKVDDDHRGRVAESIVNSSRKYNLDPRLVASIMIVESRANPFAISAADSIGIMQIHLPTWGQTADKEGINLFKIEDNVDFGARILKDYVRRFGLWEGVKRYKGWNPDSPDSLHSVSDYLAKVQRIYSFDKTAGNPEALQ